ncbi:MAG: hypothetical protein NC548_41505 [Lachnospiraceae bacterium]|nr:hypothetical protein [Lachnospiraceae bacterium]
MKVKRQWRGILTGFAAGVLVMLLAGRIAGVYNREPEQNTGELQEEGQETGAVDREEMQTLTGKETVDGEPADKETADKETVDRGTEGIPKWDTTAEDTGQETDRYHISEHVQIPAGFTEQILLYGYIEYGIRKYNEATCQTATYACDMEEDMLAFDTEFCMADAGQEPYKTDLAKEIIPELANNIYNFRLRDQDHTIYMSIDTYNMKIYVYDAIVQRSTGYYLSQ